MKKITSEELRELYLKFFSRNGHKVIESASLIPENDPTVLFTTAGMHPLVPYLLGEAHPAGKRLTNVQKCVRTGDIDEVGDASHCTFFEMLGNWSLGDYFKKEAIAFSFEFLTSPEYLGIPLERLAFTVFEGDGDAPRDDESAQIWQSLGVSADKIFYLPKSKNWWGPAGITGPCGPDTEMFIDTGKPKCSLECSPACGCGKYLEIWNDVFMQYFKTAEGKFTPLKQKNVDTGMGLERTLCVLNGAKSVYETDLFENALKLISEQSGKKYGETTETDRALRIIADHIRTATFIIGDRKGVTPSNVDQGYVLRRLIRRAVRFGRQIGLKGGKLSEIALCYVEKYKDVYPELKENENKIKDEINKEEARFLNTLTLGLKEFEKVVSALPGGVIDGVSAFRLYDTFGFPIEITCEMAKEKNLIVDTEGFKQAFAAHQQKSHAGSERRFKGGLADSTVQTARLHTATHLLLASLRRVLKEDVEQRGSNITSERLRFDFNFGRPLTDDELKQTEDLVNSVINKNIKITCEEMTVKEAKDQGATGIFTDRYGEKVKVYTIGDFSKEICGGPHASSTGELGTFVITKEQSSSAGIRRIKAELR
jgi:alanyl-tRNA synthetase